MNCKASLCHFGEFVLSLCQETYQRNQMNSFSEYFTSFKLNAEMK